MRDILTTLEADKEIGNLEEEEVAIIEEIAKVLERQKVNLPALRDIPKKKLLKLIKFSVSLRHTALQRLMNYFMQELLFFLIGWEQRLIR